MRIIIACCFILLVCSCSNPEDREQKAPVKPTQTDSLPYYDVSGMIRHELSVIKNTPGMLMYKLTDQQGKKDSAVIDTAELMRLAVPFYETDLNQPAIKKEYKESVFKNPETKSFVFNYNTDNALLPVKSIAVMVDDRQQDFKRADMMRTYHSSDTVYQERLAWITGKKFQVIQIITAGNNELTRQTHVFWKERK